MLMKHLHIASLATLIILAAGCNKNLTEPVLHSPAAITNFTVSSNTVVLSSANDSVTVAAFSWPAPNYGVTVPVTYTLQIDQPSDTSGANAWGNAINTTITTDSLTISWLGTDFNHLLNQLGLPTGVASPIVVRLTQAVNQSNGITSAVTSLFSTLSMTVTPYKVILIYPKLYVAGDFLIPNWIQIDQPGWIMASVKSDGVFEGYVNFSNTNNAFKLCTAANWSAPNYGWGGTATTMAVNVTGNLYSAGPNYSRVVADENQLTLSLTPTNWVVAGDYNSWSVTANPMTFNPATNTWTATGLNMTAGNQWKFVGDVNYNNCFGVDAKGNFVYGNGSVANFTITKTGTYTVTLDLSKGAGNYTYSIQ
jgi:starch-binding outer membrane protein SusE/F